MDSNPLCPRCQQANTYTDTISWFCADCGHKWNDNDLSGDADKRMVRDANGTELNDGDTVTLIKDLKVHGTSSVLKVGTKTKNIRIVDGDHDIDCKTELGPMMLKSGFLKKPKMKIASIFGSAINCVLPFAL